MPRRSDFVPSTPTKRRRGAKEEVSPVKQETAKGRGRGKAAATATANGRGKGKGRAKSDSEDAHEPTGLTSDESSELSDDSAFEPGVDEEEEVEEVEVISVADSDDDRPAKKPRASGGKATPRGKGKVKNEAAKGAKRGARGGARRVTALGEELDSEDDVELEDGQEVAGRIYPAPKEGRVPPGRISRNTLAFLTALMDPECNDREWFRSHEPAFRQAEKEFRDFVDVLQVKLSEVDDELPVLPARDICHRIYRDIRFSSDKTPYKTNFGMTYSRSGRHGPWAAYHLYIEPGSTVVACGLWQPEKALLQRLRDRVQARAPGPGPLRAAIGAPAFVKLFGKASPHPNGGRRNVFGHRDELKFAPKGVPRDHRDIDLLKLRTFSVVRHFTDAEVLDPHFIDTVQATVAVMMPFVRTLNDYIAPP